MAITRVFEPFKTRPPSQSRSNRYAIINLIKDNYSLHIWLTLGAVIQGLICLLPYRNIALVAPAFLLLGYEITVTLLKAFGVLHNPYMDGVVNGRTAVLFSSEKGTLEEPGQRQICAIMLAARCNHPLGMFGPGFKETGAYMRHMTVQLEEEAEKWGYLGTSSWISTHDRGVQGETMTIHYFNNDQAVHAYAHGALHTEAMEWWQKNKENLKHISMMHEIFSCPPGMWEGVYLNYAPTGLGRTTQPITLADGTKAWSNPLVKASGRSLAYSKGRMGRAFDQASEWSAYEQTLGPEDVQ